MMSGDYDYDYKHLAYRDTKEDDIVWIDRIGNQHEFKCMNCTYALAVFNFLKKYLAVIPDALNKRVDGCMDSVVNLFDNLDEE